MSSVSIIEKVINSEVLLEEMLVLPKIGNSNEGFIQEETSLVRNLSDSHKSILRKWNGFNLDVIRLYGCGVVHEELKRLSTCQTGPLTEREGVIVFGDDPVGFVYGEQVDGSILSEDTSTGDVKVIAKNMDDFFERLVFGVDAVEFGGIEWEDELKDAGVLKTEQGTDHG